MKTSIMPEIIHENQTDKQGSREILPFLDVVATLNARNTWRVGEPRFIVV